MRPCCLHQLDHVPALLPVAADLMSCCAAAVLQDMVIFMGLLNDLFPGVDPARKRDMAFEEVIKNTT